MLNQYYIIYIYIIRINFYQMNERNWNYLHPLSPLIIKNLKLSPKFEERDFLFYWFIQMFFIYCQCARISYCNKSQRMCARVIIWKPIKTAESFKSASVAIYFMEARLYRDADRHHVSSVSAFLMKYRCRCVCAKILKAATLTFYSRCICYAANAI